MNHPFPSLYTHTHTHTQGGNNILARAALTMQTERKCLGVKKQQIRSLSDGGGRGLCGKRHGERAERDDSSRGVNYKNGRYTRHITFNKPFIEGKVKTQTGSCINTGI